MANTIPLKQPRKGRFSATTLYTRPGEVRGKRAALRERDVLDDLRSYCRGDFGRQAHLEAIATNETTWRSGELGQLNSKRVR